ncbi:MAG TPA: ornithine cyclodeaminase family protein [Steroidobacteraceae bacterium]|nr:ornithine cyclodeaminase family protein [Steroidobacteraceae bacterium]
MRKAPRAGETQIMIHIDFDAVHRLVSVGRLVEPLRRAFTAGAHGPERVQYDLATPGKPRTLLLMPSWRLDGDIGVKIVTVFPDNADRELPSVNAAYVLLSGQTGQPRAWIDGRALTLMRTAAVSALAADVLAPKAPDALLMVGTGALSRYLVEGHLAVRNYKSIAIWGRDPRKAAVVARDLGARGWPVGVTQDLASAARSADVISCATLAEQPLIRGDWLKSTCHLDLVGSFKPTMREADDECLRNAFVAVDTLAALHESGDLSEPLARGVVEVKDIYLLGELIASGRTTPHPCRSVFKSVGVSRADLAAAEYLYERHQLEP